jgi:phasin family protein
MTPSSKNSGNEQIRNAADDASESVKSGVDALAKGFERVTDQFTNVLGFSGPKAEELARQSSHNIEAVSQASTVLIRGFQDVSHEVFELAQERLKKNTEALSRIAQCRSVQDFVAAQSELVRDNLQQLLDATRRVAEVSLRSAEEAARTIAAEDRKNSRNRRAA